MPDWFNYFILIVGESGTGKKTIARAMHEEGPYKHLPPNELDCEEQRDTIEMSFGNALSEGDGKEMLMYKIEYLPQEFLPDVMISNKDAGKVIATTRDPKIENILRYVGNECVKGAGAVIESTGKIITNYPIDVLNVPPLRECKEDIAVIFPYYLQEANPGYAESMPDRFYCAIIRRFNRYDWPTNVTELVSCAKEIAALKPHDMKALEETAISDSLKKALGISA